MRAKAAWCRAEELEAQQRFDDARSETAACAQLTELLMSQITDLQEELKAQVAMAEIAARREER